MIVNTPPAQDVFSSRPYKIALTIAVVLFLVVLTTSVLILILVSARDKSRRNEFEITLTAVVRSFQGTPRADITPTPAPELTYGSYPFVLGGSPVFSPATGCQGEHLSGQVLDQQGKPIDSLTVLVWGDYFETQSLSTGEIAHQDQGRWKLDLQDRANRRLWVQIVGGSRYLSAPVEIVFDAARCDQGQVEIVFRQAGPLD